MATDLERLVISLSADIKSYERALQKAKSTTDREVSAMENRFRRMNKNIETTFGGASRSLSTFAKGFIGAFGAQQLAQMAREAAAFGDAIGDLAEQTGASVEQIQILRYAAQQTGSSVEQMDAAIAKLAVNIGEAQRGTGELNKLLKANGIALKDAAGNARSFEDIFNDVAELVRRAPDQFAALEIVTTAFGAKNDELVTTLRDGEAGLAAWGRKLQETAGIIDDEGIAALGRLDAKWNDAMLGIENATARMVAESGPLIEWLIGQVQKFVEDLETVAASLKLFFAGDFARAAQVAAHGPETPVEKAINERRELEAAMKAVLQDQIALQGQINTLIGLRGAEDEQVIKMKEELLDLLKKEEEIEKRIAALPQYDRAPMAGRPGQAPAPAPSTAPSIVPAKPATTSGGGTGDSGMTTITTSGGLKATVAAAYQAQFEGFLRELEASGYVITSIGGYNYRNIAGTNKLSQHAYGKAIDINPATNPYTKGPLVTDMPANVEEMARRWGLAWGGAWKSVKDAMHFEADELLDQSGLNTAIAAANEIERQNEALAKQKQILLDINQTNWERYLAGRQAQTEATIAQLDEMRGLASDVFSGIISDIRAGASAGEIFANVLDKIISKLADMSVNLLTSALFGPAGTTSPGLLGSLVGGLFGAPAIAGARQHGGPVVGGSSYLVGEHGPEIFTPSVAGSVLPNSRGGGIMDVRNQVSVAPSPFFVMSVRSETARMISENNRLLPSYLAERQRRGV